jgi:hypothetical protein
VLARLRRGITLRLAVEHGCDTVGVCAGQDDEPHQRAGQKDDAAAAAHRRPSRLRAGAAGTVCVLQTRALCYHSCVAVFDMVHAVVLVSSAASHGTGQVLLSLSYVLLTGLGTYHVDTSRDLFASSDNSIGVDDMPMASLAAYLLDSGCLLGWVIPPDLPAAATIQQRCVSCRLCRCDRCRSVTTSDEAWSLHICAACVGAGMLGHDIGAFVGAVVGRSVSACPVGANVTPPAVLHLAGCSRCTPASTSRR